MRLTPETANRWLDDLARKLSGGSLRLFDGKSGIGSVLVSIPLGAPAFEPSENGRAITTDLPAVPAIASGTVGSADFCSASGATIAVLEVRERGVQDEADGDVLLDRLDVQRGGICIIANVILRLPTHA